MGCCCGCPGVACSECTGTPDKGLFVSASGITPVASGTCNNASGGAITTKLTYSGTQDPSGCITQNGSFPCEFTGVFSTDIFNPLSTIAGSGTCPTPTLTSSNAQLAGFLRLASGTYTLTLTISAGLAGLAVIFQGTAASPGGCRLTTPLSFTNSITAGTVVTFVSGGSTFNGFAFASGGTATLVFNSACCP